jgi:HNH endonuclease
MNMMVRAFQRDNIPDLPSFEIKFWSKVRKTEKCWLWVGENTHALNYSYGRVYCPWLRVRQQAHRVAFALAYGGVDEDHLVCHSCDNPLCVRPDHLFLGNHQVNIDDAKRKGRTNTARGMAHGRARFTDDDILQICQCYAHGMSQSDIARLWDVRQSVIQRIVNGNAWPHLAIQTRAILAERTVPTKINQYQ